MPGQHEAGTRGGAVTLRITHPDQTSGFSSHFQQQVAAINAGQDVKTLMPARRGRPRYLEEEEGRELVRWIDTLAVDHGPLGKIRVAEYFKHVPNGGARTATEAGILKGQGVRAGWPDYELSIPRGPWHGLVGELKSVDGAKPDEHQLDILARLHRIGYRAMVWFGAEDAKKQLLGYLQLPWPQR
jgi:hypothetical protein